MNKTAGVSLVRRMAAGVLVAVSLTSSFVASAAWKAGPHTDGWRVTDCGGDVWRLQTTEAAGEVAGRGAVQVLKEFLGENPSSSAVRPSRSRAEQLLSGGWRFTAADGRILAEIGPVARAADGRLVLTQPLAAGESVYGGGCRFDRLDKRGTSIRLRAEDGWNRPDTMYLPTPFFITSRGAGVYLNTFASMTADVGAAEKDVWKTTVDGDRRLDVYVFAAGSIAGSVAAFHRLVGVEPAPTLKPGPIVCRHYGKKDFNSFEKVRRVYDEHVKAGVKPSALIVEPWPITKAYGDEKVRAELDAMGAFFRAEGVPLAIWTPCGSVIYPKMPGFKDEFVIHCDVFTNGVLKAANTTDVPAFFENGSANPDISTWYRHPLMLDVTNSEARDWFEKNVLKFLVDRNIVGAKIDFCEFLADEGRAYGKDRVTVKYRWKTPSVFGDQSVHHAYPCLFNVNFYRSLKRVAPERRDVFVFCRGGGGIGDLRTPYYWAGDQVRSFPKLREQLRAVLNSRLSGVPYMSYDMAGYLPAHPPLDLAAEGRVFARAAGFTKFMPLLQTHGSVSHFYEMTNEVRAAYREAVAFQAVHKGLVRPLVERWTDDPRVRNLDDEFLFGDDLLVAPVLDDATSRTVYLPEGVWTNERSGERLTVGKEGRTVEVAATLAETPTFRCAGAEQVVDGLDVGPVTVACPRTDGWQLTAKGVRCAEGVCELDISLACTTDAVPPVFSVSFSVPQRDAHHKWTGAPENVRMPPDWSSRTESRLCSYLPLVSFLNDNDRNRILVAASEARRKVDIAAGLREENCRIIWKIDFFTEPEAPCRAYAVKLRLDTRDVFFGTAIEEGTAWIERAAGIAPAKAPEAAFEPLYSTWYSFHQNVTDGEIEAECAEAAKLGMKGVIVDDGWQTDDNNRGYAFCGDWEISKRRFPDMAAHVRRVHALGLKYMVWYGVPMVGVKAKNFARFKDRLLWVERGKLSDFGCLDPRFPEVRAFLCDLYEKAVREWDIDGLKLDFIDSFGFHGEDPAIRDNYAGRDIRSLSLAIDRLLRDIYARLTAIKPDFLVEFRQTYVGPVVRQYGNMMRACDCPGDLLSNRCRTANLRLTSGASAVHADMLEWDVGDTPENAARFVLASLFSTIQYSVMLRTLPEDHRRMVLHWLDFSRTHRETLLKGSFRPHHYEALYPWIEAESADERIVAVYNASTVADCGLADKAVYVVNGTGEGRIALRLSEAPSRVEVFDTFGNPQPPPSLRAGVQDVVLPVSGYLKISRTRPPL